MITHKIYTKHRWLQKCGCDLLNKNESRVPDLQSRGVSRSVIEELIERGIFTKRRRFLWDDCIQIYSETSSDQSKDQIEDVSLVRTEIS